MRLVVADCTVNYSGRLTAHLPRATRLIMVKADGCVAIHADGGAYKPINWMNSPNTINETPELWRVTNPQEEVLEISVHKVFSDSSHEFGDEPSLLKDGVEAHLQEILAAAPEKLGDGYKLVKREFYTEIGPVDLLCFDPVDETYVAVEIKRRGEIDGVEQLTRYLQFIEKNPNYSPLKGLYVAQSIKPQAKVLAAERGIAFLEIDYDEIRGIEKPQQKLF